MNLFIKATIDGRITFLECVRYFKLKKGIDLSDAKYEVEFLLEKHDPEGRRVANCRMNEDRIELALYNSNIDIDDWLFVVETQLITSYAQSKNNFGSN